MLAYGDVWWLGVGSGGDAYIRMIRTYIHKYIQVVEAMHRILHLPLSCWTDALTHEEGASSDAATSLPQQHGADTETASEERSLSSLSSERTLSSQPDHHHAAALPLPAGAHFTCLTSTKVQILTRAHEQRGRRREERRREQGRCKLTAV